MQLLELSCGLSTPGPSCKMSMHSNIHQDGLKVTPPKSNNDKLVPPLLSVCRESQAAVTSFFNPSYDTQKSLEYRKKAEHSTTIDGAAV